MWISLRVLEAFRFSPLHVASMLHLRQPRIRDGQQCSNAMVDRSKQHNDDLEDRAIGAPSEQNISTRPSLEPRVPRIAIVDAGFVGSTTAYALMMSGMAVEIVLIDRDSRRAEGHVSDLRGAEVFSHSTRIFVGDFSDSCSADVTIITAGVASRVRSHEWKGCATLGRYCTAFASDA
jgi:hypothetical protein